MKILVVSWASASNVRNNVDALYEKGILEKFITVAAFPNTRLYKLISRLPALKILSRRFFDKELYRHIKSCWWIEFLSALKAKVKGTKSALDVFNEQHQLDCYAASYLERHHDLIDCVYCYEDTAYEVFKVAKKYNIKCVYELPIGYWRAADKILGEQINLHPEWASTINRGMLIPKELERKENEIKLADMVFVPSEFVKHTLSSIPDGIKAKIVVNQYGAHNIRKDRIYRNTGNSKIKVLYAGALTQRKGLWEIFSAVKKLSDKVELTIVGGGNLNCVPLKENLSMHNYIQHLNYTDLLDLMADSDIFLFPSHFEGFALVVYDAMSQGLPVITTNVTCGAIVNNKDGWIVETGNPKQINELLNYLFDHKDEIRRVGEEAIKTAQNYNWKYYKNKQCKNIEQLF